jgi:hypothetical protein
MQKAHDTAEVGAPDWSRERLSAFGHAAEMRVEGLPGAIIVRRVRYRRTPLITAGRLAHLGDPLPPLAFQTPVRPVRGEFLLYLKLGTEEPLREPETF